MRIAVLPDGVAEPPTELPLNETAPITANATDAPVADLTSLLGTTVKLKVSLEGDAMLYALGFASHSEAAAPGRPA